ncbi:MAG: hypothetical protein NTX66_00540 [Candidatus Falkowbacteria bacterium]|nr:hypothetical protein [Candidatus Falkowbacteria bacterium]
MISKSKKINLVAADMGYGHQRAAYPLMDLSGGEIITINNYHGIPAWEKEYWEKSLRSYEKFSRLKKLPLVGGLIFEIMDAFQKIKPLYPFRDLSRPTIQQWYFYRFIKKGLGLDLIEKLNKSNLPFVTTFFVAAYMAEYHKYKGDIYCLICDTDASRAWAPLEPEKSRIKFLVPSEKVKTRFLMYGVPEKNIIVSGFPLPKENVGAKKEILVDDLSKRLKRLDRNGEHKAYYQDFINNEVTTESSAITITFAVGGAGAQKEVGIKIMSKLSTGIKSGKFHLNLVAGNRPEIRDYFVAEIARAGLSDCVGVKVVFAPDKIEYFREFNICLRNTDILWTKPSELSFYCALGLPIIISEPVGSQEDFNRAWLLELGAGIDSLPVECVDEWLPDWLNSGHLIRAAVAGFLYASPLGAYKIEALFN